MSGYFCCAVVLFAILGYIISGWNCAITFSKLFHGEDIRSKGSGNPGFTNYKRVYGSTFESYCVMVIDLLKSGVPVFLSAIMFEKISGSFQFGAAWCGLFCIIGHCFPVYYNFRGGKGFLAGCAAMWIIDWQSALIAMFLFLIVLFATKYMSLASCTAAVSCPILVGAVFKSPVYVSVVVFISSVIIVYRHKANIQRLLNGTESKFFH